MDSSVVSVARSQLPRTCNLKTSQPPLKSDEPHLLIYASSYLLSYPPLTQNPDTLEYFIS